MVKKKLNIFQNPDTHYRHGNFNTSRRPTSPSPTSYDYYKLAQRKDDKSSRCTYIYSDTGKRCKLKLELYPTYCHLHTMMVENIYIDKSTIEKAGNGLFVGPYGLKKGQIIGKYSHPWNEVKLETINKRCKDNPKCWSYVLCDNSTKNKKDTMCWDGLDIRSTILRNANDARGSKFRNNSYFEIIDDEVYMVASKDIKAFKEIFVSYGRHYWKYHN
jgi:hypothetical protein